MGIPEFTSDNELAQDTAWRVMAHERRRRALYCLTRRGATMGLGELARAVARVERDPDDRRDVPDATGTRLERSLYHCHLPKLDDAGLVDFDAETRRVRPIVDASRIELEATVGV